MCTGRQGATLISKSHPPTYLLPGGTSTMPRQSSLCAATMNAANRKTPALPAATAGIAGQPAIEPSAPRQRLQQPKPLPHRCWLASMRALPRSLTAASAPAGTSCRPEGNTERSAQGVSSVHAAGGCPAMKQSNACSKERMGLNDPLLIGALLLLTRVTPRPGSPAAGKLVCDAVCRRIRGLELHGGPVRGRRLGAGGISQRQYLHPAVLVHIQAERGGAAR